MTAPVPVPFEIADMTVNFPFDPATGRVGLQIYPASMTAALVPKRRSLRGLPYVDAMPGAEDTPASAVDSLVQVKLTGDSYSGAFAQGHTMRESPSLDRFRFAGQKFGDTPEGRFCSIALKSEDGLELEHRIAWRDGDFAFTVRTVFRNSSPRPVTVEMLSSFSLGRITPFHEADAPGRLRAHRFRSVWSAEGRLETRSLEELHLERSWSGAGAFSERFGQVGSMPVRRWFPFVAVEDTAAGVVWGAQLAWAGSWQMEIFRQHDDVCLSGGLADREFGHWLKTLAPGESIETPPAAISCVRGSLDDLCDRLTALQDAAVDRQPAVEQDLPIVFNEWCTTWGDPSQEKIAALARCLKDTGPRYLVIDAGWYKSGTADWNSSHGDWVPSPKLFPEGLARAAGVIRDQGFIPGLWFEMETVGCNSHAFSLVDHLLRRDGLPVTVRQRRFWDLNDPFALTYLTEKVIDLLESCGFGYLKVDYNETIGLGCENGGAESLGEGLRRQIEGVYRFFDRIRQRLPHLVIENCSSGGHRLEPSMLARTAMSSFSDAHELVEIPIIAANLHRLILPRQNQIWSVLHETDSDQRLVYSLAATFLGRMCLSGQVDRLAPRQWEILHRAVRLYRSAAPLIKHGTSRRFGNLGESWRHSSGGQAVVRLGPARDAALVVVHTFENSPARLEVPLPKGNWKIDGRFPADDGTAALGDQTLIIDSAGDFTAGVYLLRDS
jgi:alpha-galactosidase